MVSSPIFYSGLFLLFIVDTGKIHWVFDWWKNKKKSNKLKKSKEKSLSGKNALHDEFRENK